MATEVILPKVDMDMEHGTISVWHVADGASVAQGDPLFDIETDKAAMEVESPASGILRHIMAQSGDTVPIGRTVAWIFADGEKIPDTPPELAQIETVDETAIKASTAPLPAPEHSVPTNAGTQGTRATPAARKLAHDAGHIIENIPGTGPRGRVQSTDVRAFLQETPPPPNAPAQTIWDTASVPLNIVRSGTGDATPYLFIHGLGADANAWALVEKDLAAKGPVLRLELPCHGKSPRHQIESFAELSAQVRKATDALNLESVRVVGHSLVAAVALALADTRPRLIKTLTLLSPAGLGPQINGDILAGVGRATTATSLGPWLRQMVGDPNLITDNYAKAAMMARKSPQMRAAQADLQKTLFPDHTQSFDLTAALHRINCPARIIFGKKDQVIPWSHALQAPGHVSLNLFDGLGHMPQFEAPDAVKALL